MWIATEAGLLENDTLPRAGAVWGREKVYKLSLEPTVWLLCLISQALGGHLGFFTPALLPLILHPVSCISGAQISTDGGRGCWYYNGAQVTYRCWCLCACTGGSTVWVLPSPPSLPSPSPLLSW